MTEPDLAASLAALLSQCTSLQALVSSAGSRFDGSEVRITLPSGHFEPVDTYTTDHVSVTIGDVDGETRIVAWSYRRPSDSGGESLLRCIRAVESIFRGETEPQVRLVGRPGA